MKKTAYMLTAVIFLGMVLWSCNTLGEDTTTTVAGGDTTTSTSTTTTTTTTIPTFVIFAGFSGYPGTYEAFLWDDDLQIGLSNSFGLSIANSAYQSGTNIYVSGKAYGASGDWLACYWKDGALNFLSTNLNGSRPSWAADIAVSGTDIYAAGYYEGMTYSPACVWWNGVQTALSNTDGYAYGAALDGSDRYAVGYVYYGASHPVCWKNEIAEILPVTSTEGTGMKVCIANDIVYICGSDYTDPHSACYWTNGVQIVLTNATTNMFESYDIAVKDDKAVIAGQFYNDIIVGQACCWVNGCFTALTNPGGISNYSYACAVVLKDEDVYIGGFYISGIYNNPCYWKNGLFVALPCESGKSTSVCWMP